MQNFFWSFLGCLLQATAIVLGLMAGILLVIILLPWIIVGMVTLALLFVLFAVFSLILTIISVVL